jgi:nudix-type nucleoside diphosphatase (YffH/AdpP family)
MPEIISEKLVYQDFLKIEEAQLAHTDSKGNEVTFSRQRLKREDASIALIYNKETDKVILTRQFRYAIADRDGAPVIEIMAGKISSDEDPLEGAIREAEEECGYKIPKNNIRFINSFFASPGYTTEKFYLYYAEVTNADKVSDGGGLEEENEYIEIIEIPSVEFKTMVKNNQFSDSKTCVAGLWFLMNH